MKYVVLRATFLGIFMLAALNVWAANIAEAQDLIEKTTDKVLDTLKNDSSQVYNLVDKLVLPHFDFTRMSRLVLGKNWKKAKKSQKRRFTKAFRGLLVRTYSSALLKATENVRKITYVTTKPKGTEKAKVSAKVHQTGGKILKVDYAMRFKKSKWKVYNITVAGVSLVRNYRSEFAQDFQTIGMEKLINKIEKRAPKEVNFNK